MKYNLVFSIPVHEHYEVAVDQLVNFLYYNPNCAVVLHLSRKFMDSRSLMTEADFRQIAATMQDVFINPTRLDTRLADIIHTHLSNFDYISEVCDFEYFSMNASNELFVKSGLYDQLRNYDCGVQFSEDERWPWLQNARCDEDLLAYIKTTGNTRVVISHIEGTFYTKPLFKRVSEEIRSFYDFQRRHIAYPREEVFFPVVMLHLRQELPGVRIYSGPCYTFVPWMRKKLYCTRRDILHKALPSPGIFSVKRVRREINDYMRAYIRQKGKYDNAVHSLFSGTKRLSIHQILLQDFFYSLYFWTITSIAAFARYLGLNRIIVRFSEYLENRKVL